MSDNTCSICLEPLLGASSSTSASASEDFVGAVVPCGHCFHSNCFALWRANKGKNCKCPNCNKPAKQCLRLFISLPEDLAAGQNGDQIDDDDLSLHSTETALQEDGGQQPENHGESTIVTNELQALNGSSDDSIEIPEAIEAIPPRNIHRNNLQTVDLTQSSLKKLKTSSSPTVYIDKSQRYKSIAMRYKRRFQQKDSQFRDQYQHYQVLLQNHNAIKDDRDRINKELETRDELDQEYNARLDGANLRIVRLERDTREAMSRIKKLENENKAWETKYSRLEKSLKEAIEKARNSDMAEVQQLLDERPKIISENQNLIRSLAEANKQIDGLQKLIQQNVHTPLTKVVKKDSQPSKKRKAADLARDLRAMESCRFPNEPVLPFEDVLPSTTNKLTAVGGRMQAYFEQKQSKALSLSKNQGNTASVDTNSRYQKTASLPARIEHMERTTTNNVLQRNQSLDDELVRSNVVSGVSLKPASSARVLATERTRALNLSRSMNAMACAPSRPFSRCSK